MNLRLLHRRLAVLMSLAGLIGFAGGTGFEPISAVLAAGALVTALYWHPDPRLSLRLERLWLPQVALERDNLESQLRDLREDDETNARGVPEAPAVDLSRYTQLVSRSAELEQRNQKLEKEQIVVRRLLAEAEAKVEAQQRAHEDEPTNTGRAMPIEFAEHLNILEESIDSLKANMRAASDETAMMEQSDSVAAVSQAVSQAAEHVERARDALKILTIMVAKQ